VLVALMALGGGRTPAQAMRVKVVMTQSNGPNDTFPDVFTTTEFDVTVGGVVFDFTNDNVLVQDDVPSGPQTVTVDAGQLGSAYRVGSVVFTPSLTGVSTLCNPPAPDDPDGGVVVDLDPAFDQPGTSVDFVVAIRIVNKNSDPLEGGTSCTGPGGCLVTTDRHGFRTLTCPLSDPIVTSLVVPPAIWADRDVAVQIGYSSDGSIKQVTLEEKSPSLHDGIGFITTKDASVDYPRGRGTFSIEAAIKCEYTDARLRNFDKVPQFNEWWNTHQVRASITDVHGTRSAFHNSQYACIRKPLTDKLIAGLTAVLAAGATAAALASLGPEIALWVKLTTGVTGGGATVLAAIQAIKLDPPAPNFQTIPVPLPPFIPPVEVGDEVTLELAAAANTLASNYADLAGLEKAFLQALERAQGAGDAQDLGWYTTQTNTAIALAGEWATALEALPAATSQLASAWRASGTADIVISADDVRALQDDVAINGLPFDIYDVLSQLDESGALYDLLLDLLLNADPAVVAGNVIEKLDDPAVAAAVAETVQDLRNVFANDGLCDAALCDDGDACTVDSCDAKGCNYTPGPGCPQTSCTADGECDDGDPCTDDVCTTSVCAFNAVTGDRSVACAFAYSLTPAECQGAKVPGAIGKKFTLAAQSANQLASGSLTPKQRTRAIKKANGALKKALAVLGRAEKRKKNPLPPACVAGLRSILSNAQARLGGAS
jgi:hypothetical protein